MFFKNDIFPAPKATSLNSMTTINFAHQKTISLDKQPNTGTCTEVNLTNADHYSTFLREMRNQA